MTFTSGLGDAGADPPDRRALQRQVAYLWHAFEAGSYEVTSRALPAVLRESQRAYAAYADSESVGILAEAYQITASVTRKLGEFNLAWIAGDRGIPVAEQSGDHLTATGAFRVANALLAIAAAGKAELPNPPQPPHD